MTFRIKICGIRDPQQGRAIAHLGATALGFIAVEASPRFVTAATVRSVGEAVLSAGLAVDRVGVFAEPTWEQLADFVQTGGITAIQLHRNETPEFCAAVRQRFPHCEVIKALRIRTAADLATAEPYRLCVDTLLLDAYHPHLLGGTGDTLDWHSLRHFQPGLPWLLAGGLTPNNVRAALAEVSPAGIDLSSGVERAPGDKDLTQVAQLMSVLQLPPTARDCQKPSPR
jgi:phosphoribosylanthranilate isomerase